MRKEKIILKILAFLLISFFIGTNVQAIDGITIENKSESFKKWEQLTEEEKEKTIAPPYSTISIKDSIKRSEYNFLLKEGTDNLESKYNLRTNLTGGIKVKDQYQTGSCWAFAFSSVFETTMAKKNNKNAEYSPMHMDYTTSTIFNRKLGDGGHPYIAIAYAASGVGPVYESDLPFSSVYNETTNTKENYYLSSIDKVDVSKTARARVEKTTKFANIYKEYNNGQLTYGDSIASSQKYTEAEIQAIRKLVKQHIKEDGAVSTLFYSDIGGVIEDNNIIYQSEYYDDNHKSYYCNNYSAEPNHAVTIVRMG